MTPRRAITPPDCRASLRAVKPLRFAPTPFGAGGLDGPSGPPRIGNYVMAGMHPTTRTHSTQRKGENHVRPDDHAQHRGDDRARDAPLPRVHHHGTRHASTRRRRSRSTPAPLSDVSGMAANPISLDATRADASARLVLVDGTELAWQRARYREGAISSRPPIQCSSD